MQWSEKDVAEASRIAKMTGFSVEKILEGWEKQYEHEAQSAEAYDRMFPSDE